MKRIALFCTAILLSSFSARAQAQPLPKSAIVQQEKHLSNIRQLTFEGENAEAYLSFDEKRLIFQSHNSENDCDQIYSITLDGRERTLLSTGKGRTTCSYFMPDGKHILYASTHEAAAECPPPADMSNGYVWMLYPSFDIFTATADGKGLKPLIKRPGYDAEATVSPKGDRIVFTSTHSGDIELYTCNLEGGDIRQITDLPGYDGGAFFSFDGTKIVYRASRPQGKDLEEYRNLLAKNMIKPRNLEIYVANADGSNPVQLTNNGKANFAPFFHPDGKRVIFSSNIADPKGRNFDLYMINIDGTGLERITHFDGFDGFPMFTRDGKTLVFCSNRNNARPGDTNIFVADWKD